MGNTFEIGVQSIDFSHDAVHALDLSVSILDGATMAVAAGVDGPFRSIF
jgi:hypothetical protein